MRALIVGKFAPLHVGHQFLIETALSECAYLTVLVYSNPDFHDMPQPVRAGWVSALYPSAHVLVPDDPPPDSADDDTHRHYVKEFLHRCATKVDVVYTSENYGDGFAAVLGVQHRLVDRMRISFPVSGTMARGDLLANWHLLSGPARAYFRQRGAVDIPE